MDDFLKEAKRFGFCPFFPCVKDFIKKTGVIPLKFSKGKVFGRCDVIIAENPLEIAAINRGRLKRIDSFKVRFVTLEDLIIHKIASDRERDLEDVKGILIRQERLDVGYILSWLKIIDKNNPQAKLVNLFDRLIREEQQLHFK